MLRHLLMGFVLLPGCGALSLDSTISGGKGSADSGAPSTPAPTASPDEETAVVPPQVVIGSYLVAEIKNITLGDWNGCEVKVSEVNGNSTTAEVVANEYSYLGITDLKDVSRLSVECADKISASMITLAERFVSDVDRNLLAQALITNPGDIPKSAVSMSIPESGKLLGLTVVTAVASQPAPASVTTQRVDTIAPRIRGLTTAPHSDPTKKFVNVIGAIDETALAQLAYSFDGGATWKRENHKAFVKGTVLPKGTVRVRDAARNETLFNVAFVVQ